MGMKEEREVGLVRAGGCRKLNRSGKGLYQFLAKPRTIERLRVVRDDLGRTMDGTIEVLIACAMECGVLSEEAMKRCVGLSGGDGDSYRGLGLRVGFGATGGIVELCEAVGRLERGIGELIEALDDHAEALATRGEEEE